MPRIYTRTVAASDGVITPDIFNQENAQIADAFNGNLDSHQIPANSIDYTKFTSPVVSTDGDYTICRGPIHHTYSGFHDASTDLWTPEYQVSLAANNRSGGWIKLSDDLDAASITMSSLNPGTITGCCVIDWERRRGHNTTGSTDNSEDISWPVEFMVFYDDMPMFPSGELYPRRHTLTIPITQPTSGGTHTFDVRWRGKAGIISDAAATAYLQLFNIYQVGFSLVNTQA